MEDETQLALLELTVQGNSVNVEQFVARSRQRQNAETTINRLLEARLVSIADGFLSMDMNQRMLLAERMIHEGQNPTRVSRYLEWREFENFANYALIANGFQTVKHFVFKTGSGRREIDILSWNDNFLLAIDCKHWLRRFSSGRLELVARAQTERVRALAKRSELLVRAKIGNISGRSITPIILTLRDTDNRIVSGVPIVPVSKLMSFLYGISPIDDAILRIRIRKPATQSLLL